MKPHRALTKALVICASPTGQLVNHQGTW